MSVSESSYSTRFTLCCRRETSCLFWSVSHFSNLCFCFLFPQAASCVTLSIASSSSSLSSSSFASSSLSFRLPSDGPQAPWDRLPFPGSCCLEILIDLDRHTLGSAGSLLSSASLSPHICISVNLDASLCLLLIILCGLPSSRSPWWTGGRVAREHLGDASSCAVVSWIHSLYI